MNTVQLRAGQTSQPFTVGIGSVSTITPSSIGGGTGYIEYSLSPAADILNGLGVWLQWPLGAVSVATSKTALYVISVRAVCSAGNILATFGDPTNSFALSQIVWDANEPAFLFDANGIFLGLNGPAGTTSATPAMLWAARPTPTTANIGREIRFTDVGGNTGSGGGNFFFSNGIRWKPVNNSIILDSVDTANSGIANTSEQQLNPNHIVIPAGVIGDFDRLRLWVSVSKDAAVDSTTLRIRFGQLGTVADAVIATITTLASTNQSIGFLLEFKRISSVLLQKQGNASTDASYTGANSGAYPTPVTVVSMNTNPMFLSITSQLTAGTEIVTLQDYTLELYATDSQ